MWAWAAGWALGMAMAGPAWAGADPSSWPRFRASEAELLKQAAVDYPPSAGQLGFRDVRCVVEAAVRASGRPATVRVLDCPDLFHEAVIASVLKWRWAMPELDGQRSPGRLELAVRFRVSGAGAARIGHDVVEKTPDIFDEVPEAELDPRVVPFEVPTEASVQITGGQPWSAPKVPIALEHRVEPTFPQRAIDDGIYDGLCVVDVELATNGRPSVAVGGCDETLAEDLLRTVQRWSWAPPRYEGGKAVVRFRFRVEFRAYPDHFYEDLPEPPAPEEGGAGEEG